MVEARGQTRRAAAIHGNEGIAVRRAAKQHCVEAVERDGAIVGDELAANGADLAAAYRAAAHGEIAFDLIATVRHRRRRVAKRDAVNLPFAQDHARDCNLLHSRQRAPVA